MSLERYLGELLYSHDCVIIPGFGGFVCNHNPARVNPSNHTFTPPSKSISFNRNLKNNDGLLANHIATIENKNFSDALEYVKAFALDLQDKIQKGNKVALDNIGSFFLDKEKNLLFEPDQHSNFLMDSFGLGTFRSPSIKREEAVKKLEKQFKDRITVKEKKTDGTRKINVKRLVSLAILLPVLAGGVLLAYKTDNFKNFQVSDYNPFRKAEPATYVVRASSFQPLTADDLLEKPAFNPEDQNAYQTLELGDEKGISVVVNMDKPVTDADKTYVDKVQVTHHSKGRYHIIAGAFAVPSNADNYVVTLKNKGLNAAIFENSNLRLRYVEVGSFNSQEEAVNEMSRIRGTLSEVWLLEL
jgi:nucleoid DNA-binding protein